MKVKVRKILLCVFFALFIVTLFTASFSLGRYSSVQSSESDYDDDFEYTLYDSIVVNTIDEFFAAISNGYNYIIIGDAIKDPLIIAGSMSDIRDDLIIDLNGHEIQRNSRDPLLNVTTGFTLTIIDRVGTGSMYNPVGSVIQVSGGTLTVQNGIFESGPRSDNSRDAKRHNDENEPDYVDVTAYNEYATGSNESGWNALGGGSISGGTSGTAQVTVYRNSNIGSENTSNTYGDSIGTVALPIITPKTTGRGVVNGSMYFDDAEEERIYYTCNGYNVIKDDTYLYYTYEADNMQYSTVADKSTANYYYRYYVNGGELGDTQDSVNSYFAYASDQTLKDPNDSSDQRILVTVYVFNDVKYYADEQSDYTDSSGTSGFAAVKMQSGNLYVRGGTYYSYFGEENTFGVQSTGGLMTVNPTGSNAINFYAYQNGVCVECTVDKPTENEMLNISSGKFYSELGDTVRVKNGSLTIGTADFTKDVGNASANSFGDNGDVIDISGGTLTIDTRAGFDVSGSGVRGIYSHDGDNTSVRVANATFTFNGTNNLHHNCGIYAEDGNVSCRGNTTINLSNGSEHNTGIYSAGNGYIAFGIPTSNGSVPKTKIDVAIRTSDTNYGIYSAGGSIYGYGQTTITLGSVGTQSTDSEGIHSEGGTINLGRAYTFTNGVSIAEGSTTITVNGDSSSLSNFGIQTIGGTINVSGNTEITVYGKSSTGVYSTVDDDDVTTKIVDNKEISIATGGNISISGKQFTCNVNMHWQGENDSIDYANNLSSTAISSAGGNIEINSDQVTINSDGLGITAFNRRMDANGRPINENLFNEVTDESNNTTSYIGTGNVDFEGENVDLTTVRGTAIYILGGALSTSTNSTIDVTSTIVDNLHWQGEFGDPYSYDGIYVQSGSLTSYGTFNVTHTGVDNENFFGSDHDVTADNLKAWTPKSFAVRVQGDYNTKVELNAGKIKNTVGGGLYVSGGAVTLGTQGVTDNKTLSITTEGVDRNSTNDYWVNDKDTWYNYDNKNGGDAVIVSGGTLDIYCGTYTAAFGNGIAVKDGMANVHGGLFRGNDPYTFSGRSAPAGAAASYAFKLYGGTANISGGTFGYEGDLINNSNWQTGYDKGGGAFVMGTSTARGTVEMTGGTINIAGTTGLGVWNNVDVTLGIKDSKTGPMVNAESTGITAESYGSGSSSITIYGGTYQSYNKVGGKNGIWYGEGQTTLKIHGGTFTGSGSSGSGLCVDDDITVKNAITISGGTFNGSQAGLWLEKALKANHAIVITGGDFNGTKDTDAQNAGGNYGAYYGVDGGGDTNSNLADHANDGLLIMGGAFVGKIAGFYFNDNPLSRWEEDTWWFPEKQDFNNVAIVAGTFTGDSKAIGDASNNQVKVGDVLTMHIAYTDGNTTYNHYGYAAGVNESAEGYNNTPVNNIGTSVTLTMRPK